ncbi:hypothetical protein RZV17_19935 [Xanthomonas cannabis]|uniref:hypothetical protein n=1 Tax=Xanthomonas cannabis TaxID=1885674 RepID=UPI0033B8821C
MSLNDSVSRLIEKVTWETVSGKVEWHFSTPPSQLTEGTSDVISVYVICKYKGQRLAVFEKRHKYYTDVDDWSWTYLNVFAVIDQAGRVIFETPEADIQVNNLFNLARDNASGIDNIINSLLSDE